MSGSDWIDKLLAAARAGPYPGFDGVDLTALRRFRWSLTQREVPSGRGLEASAARLREWSESFDIDDRLGNHEGITDDVAMIEGEYYPLELHKAAVCSW